MPRYSEAIWAPSPNFGYERGTHGQLAFNTMRAGRGGEFWHSIVGSLSAAKWRFLNPVEEASAHFLFPKIGRPTQMVDSGDAAWHSGDYLSNLHFHGFEFEGGGPGNYSEPLTENQIEWGIKVTRWLRETHDSPQVYVRRETLWEHNEVAATACPSGRIPWVGLINELEDDMDEAAVKVLINKHVEASNSKVRFKQIADNLPVLNQHLTNVVNALINAKLKELGVEYTDEQAVKAVKDKLA